jgi:hypothetical protein
MSALKKRLKPLLFDARRSAGIPQRRTLDDLTLQITQEKNGDVVLVLECRDRWPSATALNLIFQNWPEPLPTPRPLHTMRKEGKTHRLIARWPRPIQAPVIPDPLDLPAQAGTGDAETSV